MPEQVRQLQYFVRHDTIIVAGLLLMGFASFLSVHMLLRLESEGEVSCREFGFPIFRIPLSYLRVAREKGWRRWPAYTMWILVVCGPALIVVGFFRV